RYRAVGMRTVLSGLSARDLGWKDAGRGADRGDDRPDRRGLIAAGAAMSGTLVLVGCGKMGTAMLRGWIAAKAAARFYVVEPEGPPPELDAGAGTTLLRSPTELPADLEPDAIVFAVKPQIMDAVLPDYRRFARPATVFLSIAAGKTIGGILRQLGEAALVRAM